MTTGRTFLETTEQISAPSPQLTVDTKRKVSLSKITWENVPEDYTVTLTDLKTGRSVDMNRKDVYFFITIFDPIRDFEVEVVRR
jgi:hypothetical protein